MATETAFTVKRQRQGRWSVCETGFEEPLAEFDERDDALDYARDMASTKPRASVDAEGDDTLPDLHETYALDPVSGKSSRTDA